MAILFACGAADAQPRGARRAFVHEPIVRVPIVPPPPQEREIELGHGHPAACLDAGAILGATVMGDHTIEIAMENGERWQMTFADDCPFLGFYSGFYYRRTEAGRLCAGHDSVLARSGGECAIQHIRKHKGR